MDHQKFGAFIAALRKEKGWTQRELAECLKVTDKAVSKWERGLGFPDIQTMEPLAEVLGVSVLELMRGERTPAEQVGAACASEALSGVIDVVAHQRKAERRNILRALLAVSALVMAVFLLDVMGWAGFLMACLPVACLAAGAALLVMSWHRHRQKHSCMATLVWGLLALVVPAAVLLLLWSAMILGGPVPN